MSGYNDIFTISISIKCKAFLYSRMWNNKKPFTITKKKKKQHFKQSAWHKQIITFRYSKSVVSDIIYSSPFLYGKWMNGSDEAPQFSVCEKTDIINGIIYHEEQLCWWYNVRMTIYNIAFNLRFTVYVFMWFLRFSYEQKKNHCKQTKKLFAKWKVSTERKKDQAKNSFIFYGTNSISYATNVEKSKQTIEFIKKIGSEKTIEFFFLLLNKNWKNKIRFGQIKCSENVSF